MTRTSRMHALCGPLAAAFLLCATVGCGPNEKDLKIQDLTAEGDELKNDLSERDRQLNDALVRENEARETIDELNREMATLRAEGEKFKTIGEWRSTPTFDMISISDAVLFPSGKAVLSATGRAKLTQVAADIRSRYGDRDIYVFGHTDAQPIRKSKWKDNWELGAHRALIVTRALAGFGISRERLIQANCGPYRPIVTNTAKRNLPGNRRVEIFAVNRNTGTTDRSASRGYLGE